MFFFWLSETRLSKNDYNITIYNYHLYHTLYIKSLKYLKMKNKHQQILLSLK